LIENYNLSSILQNKKVKIFKQKHLELVKSKKGSGKLGRKNILKIDYR
jgi:hypothetical protein